MEVSYLDRLISRSRGPCAARTPSIETDDGAYTDVTSCMLLIGTPGQVGDGSVPEPHQGRWHPAERTAVLNAY